MKKQVLGQMSLFDMEENPFLDCIRCWCADCKHNARKEAVPRSMLGVLKPCPACELCLKNNGAEPCMIGSYENGCSLRAEEEGIFE